MFSEMFHFQRTQESSRRARAAYPTDRSKTVWLGWHLSASQGVRSWNVPREVLKNVPPRQSSTTNSSLSRIESCRINRTFEVCRGEKFILRYWDDLKEKLQGQLTPFQPSNVLYSWGGKCKMFCISLSHNVPEKVEPTRLYLRMFLQPVSADSRKLWTIRGKRKFIKECSWKGVISVRVESSVKTGGTWR